MRKNQWYKWLYATFLAVCLAGAGSVLADHHGGGGGGWHGGGNWHGGGGWHHHEEHEGGGFSVFIGGDPGLYPGNYYYPPYNQECGWVGGYYNYYGYWVPPHRECW